VVNGRDGDDPGITTPIGSETPTSAVNCRERRAEIDWSRLKPSDRVLWVSRAVDGAVGPLNHSHERRGIFLSAPDTPARRPI
jgi:hypothetical protein